jgi:hypothetical protein
VLLHYYIISSKSQNFFKIFKIIFQKLNPGPSLDSLYIFLLITWLLLRHSIILGYTNHVTYCANHLSLMLHKITWLTAPYIQFFITSLLFINFKTFQIYFSNFKSQAVLGFFIYIFHNHMTSTVPSIRHYLFLFH